MTTNPLATLLRDAAHRAAQADAATGCYGRHLPTLLAHIADEMEAGRASEEPTPGGIEAVDYVGQINHTWTAAVRYARDLCARHPEVTA